MTHEWTPSPWGQRLTRAPAWRLRVLGSQLELQLDGHIHLAPVTARLPRVRRGLVWGSVTLETGHAGTLTLRGLPSARAAALGQAVERLRADLRGRDAVADFTAAALQIRQWLAQEQAALAQADQHHQWFTATAQHALLAQRPVLPMDEEALWAVFDDPARRGQLEEEPAEIEALLLRYWSDWPATWRQRNDTHLEAERRQCHTLLAQVERQPLSAEQVRAVLCFETHVQVVAAAGSGKTSTMVAKAAYAVQRGLVAPERIVLLAFNRQAAEELQTRTDAAFARLGMPDVRVEARTFHALGRRIIGKATGRMPDVPEWAVDTVQGFNMLATIVDQLKDRSLSFRTRWDMFRLVFGRDLPPLGSALAAEEWDRQGEGYVRTLRGERVRSLEECVIADWLFYNGVDYRYEARYEFDTATDEYRQYRPDFHYPGIDLYHEHLALDAHGQPPAHFTRYAEDLAWKRAEHQRRGTDLVETTSHQLRTGALFEHLGAALTRRGIVLDPNPDRELPEGGARPLDDNELIGLVRTFISHAKSNGLGVEEMAQRLGGMPEDYFKHRHRLFLALATPILHAWDDALAAEGGIDFEDMLNQAAEHLEQGRHASPFELVMADEFQDASRARARLCRALVQEPGSHFFAVGDDWQSINRFAGADVSVMTGFLAYFGHGEVLKLEQTFRCPQALCDVSSAFVSRNPAQIPKQVRSMAPDHGPALQAFQVPVREQLRDAVAQYLEQLHQQLASGQAAPGRNGKVSVFVLGRYNSDRAYVPAEWKARYGHCMDLSFLTAHRAKGAEADYVLLPGMLDRSFPSTRADDPVLALAMPHGDDYPLGEERRLFYVALTRARRSVALFTVRGRRSPFLAELVSDGAVRVTSLQGEAIRETACPACGVGVIVQRTGKFGAFQSCSGFPRCEYKPRRQARPDLARDALRSPR